MLSLSIGRSEKSDIVFEDKTVSRLHARITKIDDDLFLLEDLDSTNGTYVNGGRITTPTEVHISDKIEIGSQHLNWKVVLAYFERNEEVIPLPVAEPSVSVRKWMPFAILMLLVIGFSSLLLISKEKNEAITVVESKEGTVVVEPDDSNNDSNTLGFDSISQAPLIENKESTNELVQSDEDIASSSFYSVKKDPIEYSISCLREGSDLNELIGIGADIEDGWITFSADEVGVAEELKVGKELKKDVDQEYTYNSELKYSGRIEPIFKKLISGLDSPRMKYTYYIVNSNDINAFTAGGLIFITTGIIDFAISNDELACVIGHEIYHNELGHINKMIRKEKAAQNWFGDFADWTLIASSIAGASFNQENEAYCDMYGVDLAIKAGYDGKAASQFWSRMESSSNDVDKLFSTHPFSEERMDCIDEHLNRNYWGE
ncbi:MAG: M48 family metalloprotease [Crocinitomicaceae bacterium]|nr:M48 family metalloprotease [Crocinitomicaceae bacterium]